MPKKGQKLTDEQRAAMQAGLEKARARRREEKTAAKQAEKVPTNAPENVVTPVAGYEAEVVPPKNDARPLTLSERLKALRGDKGSAPAAKRKDGAEEENFIFLALPLASGFLAFQASRLWEDEYKAAAPSKAEVSAILKPIFRIVARRLEINIKETPDIRDMRLAGTALLTYVFRAATASIDISERLEEKRAVQYAEQFTQYGASRPSLTRLDNISDFPGTNAGNAGRGNNQSAAIGASGVGGGPGGGNVIPLQPTALANSHLETDAEYARRVISEAYKQDRQYRAEHGFL